MNGFVNQIRQQRRDDGVVSLAGQGPRLRAEALIEMARRATAVPEGSPTGRPLVWVVSGEHPLRTGKGIAELAGGGIISALTAQRLACDGDIADVLIDPKGKEIKLGRTRRRASPNQRRIIAMRDGGCDFVLCDAPPEWCEVHHVTPWEQGGETDVSKMRSECTFHHHLVHEGGFRLEIRDGRSVYFRPDGTRIDPPTIAS